MATTYDAIIIGTGQAGPSLAVRLAGAGMKAAIVERKRFGGTCVNNGCIPTKTLVASARAAHVARRAGEYGVTIDGAIAVDMKKVKARKDAVVRQLQRRRGEVAEEHGELDGLRRPCALSKHAHRGACRRRAARSRARSSSMSAGGPRRLPLPGLDQVSYLNNSTMMDVDFLPEHLIVIGGSYIGLEFAQMYRRFGSEVTIVEMGPRLIQREDEDVSAAIRTILENEGIEIRLSAECIALEKRGDKVAVSVDCTRRR